MRGKSKIQIEKLALIVGVVALLIGGGAYLRVMLSAKSPVPEVADKPAEKLVRVVYHADFADPRRFSAMLTSINNMVTTYQSNFQEYDVRIVFVAHGIRFLTEDRLAGTPFAVDNQLRRERGSLHARLFALRDIQGVKLELCGITRESINLPAEKLVPGVKVVTSGVVRLAELQRQGFAYIKIE